MNIFRDRLKDAMFQARMNQSDLAAKTGCSKGAISGYVNGTSTPNEQKIRLLADALGVQVSYLMGESVGIVNGVPPKITPEIAAKCIGGVGYRFVCQGLITGTLPIGTAVQMPGGKYRYNIVPFKLRNYVGEDRFNEFFKVTA